MNQLCFTAAMAVEFYQAAAGSLINSQRFVMSHLHQSHLRVPAWQQCREGIPFFPALNPSAFDMHLPLMVQLLPLD
jgi:hypothetical protein